MKYFLFLVLSIIFLIEINGLNLKNKIEPDVDSKNPKVIPLLNVHIEEPNLDSLQMKRIEEEKRIERDKITSLEHNLEEDRNNFLRVIEKQNELIAKLNNIVEITHKSLEVLMKNGDILI